MKGNNYLLQYNLPIVFSEEKNRRHLTTPPRSSLRANTFFRNVKQCDRSSPYTLYTKAMIDSYFLPQSPHAIVLVQNTISARVAQSAERNSFITPSRIESQLANLLPAGGHDLANPITNLTAGEKTVFDVLDLPGGKARISKLPNCLMTWREINSQLPFAATVATPFSKLAEANDLRGEELLI